MNGRGNGYDEIDVKNLILVKESVKWRYECVKGCERLGNEQVDMLIVGVHY